MVQTGLAETHLFYSSLTLVAMSCSTIVFFILFRLKCHQMNSLPGDLSANVYDKIFCVFDPYSERRKLIHNFLVIAYFSPLIIAFVSWYLAPLAFFWLIESSLLLSVALLIFCINLMLLGTASETYQNARLFIKAFNNKADLGVGDLKVFQTLERVIPKLGNYYLALSILFLTVAATLGYIWYSLFWFFTRVIGLIFELQALIGGAIAFPVSIFLFSLIFGVVLIFMRKIVSKILSHLLG